METRDALNGRTRFWYESNGNVAAIEDAKGVVTRASYNSIGQRTGVDDPNQGVWSFAYNALGEVLSQTDARGIVTSMNYDRKQGSESTFMIKSQLLPLFLRKIPFILVGILDNGWEMMAKRHENDFGLCCALLPLVLLLGCAEARDARVEGRAVYADGAPVSGGVIVFTDLVGRPFSMPKPRRLAEVVTTEDGGFSVELKEVEGDVDANLMRRKCVWQGAVVMLTDRESVGGKIVLTTKRESCGSNEGDKALEK